MCFLSRSSYEFILLSFCSWNGSERRKDCTIFACRFNSPVTAEKSEMNEWKSTEISIPSGSVQKRKGKKRRAGVEDGKAFNFDCLVYPFLKLPCSAFLASFSPAQKHALSVLFILKWGRHSLSRRRHDWTRRKALFICWITDMNVKRTC